jgi:hypothetical protein
MRRKAWFIEQQPVPVGHLNLMALSFRSVLTIGVLFAALGLFSAACTIKTDRGTATLLKAEDATRTELLNEVNRFARVNSMRAKMDLKFEDNSFAQFGSKEVQHTSEGAGAGDKVRRRANDF